MIPRTGVRFLRQLALSAAVCFLIVASVPAAQTDNPTIDQAPLTTAAQLPPNIVLMLDDSGSMAWDVMPDSPTIPSGATTKDALVSADINGVYYNPTTTYTPPCKVSGDCTTSSGRYPASSFTGALQDGFDSTSSPIDLNSFDGTGDSASGTKPVFAATFSYATTNVQNPSACPKNSTFNNTSANTTLLGQCVYSTPAPYAPTKCSSSYSGYSDSGLGTISAKCIRSGRTDKVPVCSTSGLPSGADSTLNATIAGNGVDSTAAYAGQCVAFVAPSCPDSSYSYTGSPAFNCQKVTTSSISMFTYTVRNKDSSGAFLNTFTRHYVGNSGKCAQVTSSQSTPQISASVCHDDDASRQNVANWFTYYHTRILMAKSGLMTTFADLAPTIRFGYGSINGGGTAQITSTKGAGFYSFATTTNASNRLAQVSTFDSNCTPTADPLGTCTKGQSGTQRANFWDWLVGESPTGNTPLRGALNAVGKYYSTAQPWNTSSTDSNQLECRQSYTILTTDGFWNEVDDNNSQTLQTLAVPTGDKVTLPSSLRPSSDVDSTIKVTHANPAGGSFSYDGTDKTKSVPWRDTSTTTTYALTSLADVALYYWLMDLQPSLPNKVPTSPGVDPAFWQHMTTFTVGLGFTPTGIKPTGTTVADIFKWANDGGGNTPASAISSFSWPQPVNNTVTNIADLAHAAVNGHGGFYSANNPEEFSSGIADALRRVSQRSGSGASLAANSTKLDTSTMSFQATYQSGLWTGDITAFPVNASTGVISAASWSASAKLPAATGTGARVIKTSNGSTMVDFVASGGSPAMSSTQLGYFGSNSTDQTALINYLRGSSSGEQRNGGTFRNRTLPVGSVNGTAPLGDIVNSQPVYVGAPDPNLYSGKTFTGSSSYSSFATKAVADGGVAGRQATLWVAANDGMLHGFNATTGVETFAYLPAALLPTIKNYADQNYGSSSLPHQYYNDGLLTVSDIYDNSNSKWRTVLVGTTGRGFSKAVYALDVSDPSSPSLLWEHSASESGYTSIGQITGQPIIAQTADGVWSVLIGNGYNSTGGKAALLQFEVIGGTLTTIATDTSTGNGLSAPAVWLGNPANGISTIAYAGDILGRVWSFTLGSSPTSTNIFTAMDAASPAKAQPITGGMLAGKDPVTGNIWIFFGTGKYLTSTDLTAPSGGWINAVQTWYGLIVTAGSSGYTATSSTTARSDLAQRTIAVETTPSGSSLAARGITTPTAGDMTNKSGWYLDLVSPGPSAKGERMVTPSQFQGNLLIGTSRLPTTNSNSCSPSGSGWIMAVSPFTGAPPEKPYFDITQNGSVDQSDNITTADGTTYIAAGVGLGKITNNPIFVGNDMLLSYDDASYGNIQTAGTTGLLQRLTWRELLAK